MLYVLKGLKNAVVYMLITLMFFPATIFFPVYNYKKTKLDGFKWRWIIHLITLVFITIFSYFILNKSWSIPTFYLILLVPELIIDIVLRYTRIDLPILDVGVISSFILGIILLFFYKYIGQNLDLTLDEVRNLYTNIGEISVVDFNLTVEYLKNNIYTVVFVYSYMMTMILYLGIWERVEIGLSYSYYFLILYVIVFFASFIYKDHILLKNLVTIFKITYLYNGILSVAKWMELSKGRKIGKVSFLGAIFLSQFIIFKEIFLIIGAYKAIYSSPHDGALERYREYMIKKYNI